MINSQHQPMSVRHRRLLAGSVRAHGPHCAMFRNLLTSLAKEPITVGSRASRSFSVPTIGLLVPKLVEARNGFQGQSAMPHMLSLGRYAWPQLQELISAHKRYGYCTLPFLSLFRLPLHSPPPSIPYELHRNFLIPSAVHRNWSGEFHHL
jgi:hypothetical protein